MGAGGGRDLGRVGGDEACISRRRVGEVLVNISVGVTEGQRPAKPSPTYMGYPARGHTDCVIYGPFCLGRF